MRPKPNALLEGLYGFDPNEYVGGRLIGFDQGMHIDPAKFHEVSTTLMGVSLEKDLRSIPPSWHVVFSHESADTERDTISGGIDYIRIQKNPDGSMSFSVPYVGEFRILKPESATDNKVYRALHEIRSKDIFHNN